MMRRLALLLPAFVAACAVAEYPYPATWDPLVPPREDRCDNFAGVYADRGERGDEPSRPSLTRELFGEFSGWEKASTVQLAMPKDGALDITVGNESGTLFKRTLLRNDRDFACRDGRLMVRDARWIGGYIMSGRQHVEVELNYSARGIVAQVDELSYGVMFIIFPIVGSAKHWYRFERLP